MPRVVIATFPEAYVAMRRAFHRRVGVGQAAYCGRFKPALEDVA